MAQKTIDWLIPQTFPKVGFQSLPLVVDEKKICSCYRRLGALSDLLAKEYSDEWQELDNQILLFLNRNVKLNVDFKANYDPVTFNNIHHDGIKYKMVSQGGVSHQMRSFHYIEGTYEGLREKIPPLAFDFLKELSQILSAAKEQLTDFIEVISAKVTPFFSLKLWQHVFESTDQQLLPIHVDRS